MDVKTMNESERSAYYKSEVDHTGRQSARLRSC